MSISLRNRIRRTLLLGCVSGAALILLGVAQASAAVYPGGGSTFTGGAQGWEVKGEPTCKVLELIEVKLVCEATAGYSATVGNPAGSFESKVKNLVDLVGVDAGKATIQSPEFTVAEGGTATLHLERQFEPGALIALGPTGAYEVGLLDKTTGVESNVLEEAMTAKAPFGAKDAVVSVTAGQTYQIVIKTEIKYNAGLLSGLIGETASLNFDNVSLTVSSGSGGGGGGNGGGSGGNGGESGENISLGRKGGNSGGVSSARLESLIRSSSLIGPAVLKGNRLTVKAACPKKVGTTCTLTLQGALTKGKAATTSRRARVKQGKNKQFVLKVKPAAMAKVKAKKKLLFKETVRAGKARTTVWKSLKLVRE